MRRLFYLVSLSLFLLTAGCDSGGMEGPVSVDSITGTWQGTVITTDFMGVTDTLRIDMNLNEVRREVSGDGTVTGPGGAQTFEVLEGSSYFHPTLNLDLFFGGPPLGGLDGTVSQDRRQINATMSGPGFSGPAEFQIVLTRMAP